MDAALHVGRRHAPDRRLVRTVPGGVTQTNRPPAARVRVSRANPKVRDQVRADPPGPRCSPTRITPCGTSRHNYKHAAAAHRTLIRERLDHLPAVASLGPRQLGETTMAQVVIADRRLAGFKIAVSLCEHAPAYDECISGFSVGPSEMKRLSSCNNFSNLCDECFSSKTASPELQWRQGVLPPPIALRAGIGISPGF